MRIIVTAIILYNEIKDDSPEDIRDISVQADWISDIIETFDIKTVKLPFSLRNVEELIRLKESGPAFAFNLVDAAPGEENFIYLAPSILDALKIPYTGCSTEALFLTTNKILTKELLKSYAMPTSEWVARNDSRFFLPNERYIIKALYEDASIGLDRESVVFARSFDELALAIAAREGKEGKDFFAERYIEGREFNVYIYGTGNNPVVLPPYEWVFPGFEEAGLEKIIDYNAKWTENVFEYDQLKAVYHLPEEDSDLADELVHLSRNCWEKFGLNGYAKIDFRIDNQGNPWILEINANPSLYGFFNIARAYGLEFNEIIKTIVNTF